MNMKSRIEELELEISRLKETEEKYKYIFEILLVGKSIKHS